MQDSPPPQNRQAIAWTPQAPLPADAHFDALYLHLPFCFHKCHYCDFYSVVDQPTIPGTIPGADPGGVPGGVPGGDRQEAFTDALIAEIETRHAQAPLRPRTVFVGGGTPTYLRPALWTRLLDTMHRLDILADVTEFTVEANPETVTPALMRQLADGGVNRVSIGAQSFQRESLAALERWHDPDNVPKAVNACRAAGITNLSLDLIFAIPGQTPAMLDRDLDSLVALRPTHLSTYGLTYEPNTSLTARLRLGQVTPIDEDTERAMYAHVLDRLAAEGFEQYEVSNWALGEGGSGKTEGGSARRERQATVSPSPASGTSAFRLPTSDFRCAHNLAYWHNRNWLGLGPAAASHLDGHRWRNAPNLARYLQQSPAPPIEDHEHLPPRRQLGERLMLGLRLNEGLPLDWLNTALADHPRTRAAIDEMVALQMLEHAPLPGAGAGAVTRLRLTRRGLFVADSVIAKLL